LHTIVFVDVNKTVLENTRELKNIFVTLTQTQNRTALYIQQKASAQDKILTKMLKQTIFNPAPILPPNK
jgi:hypothetical protein